MTLRLEGATVRRGGRAILDAASMAAAVGRLTAVCGPNGAGKTTALSVLAGSLKPDGGRASMDGAAIGEMKSIVLARRRAVLPQSATLGFPFLVHEVVAMGRTPHHGRTSPHHDGEIVEAAMAKADVSALAERNYLTLSGGERQRVQLARALAQVWDAPEDGASRWLLLDEPTAALDLKHQIDLMRLLADLAAAGWGIVTVLHDLALVKAHADAVVLFKDARVAHTGPAADVLTPQTVQAVFGLDAPYAV